jgi:conjugal transfer mating pair stabilization protein TraN
LNIEPKIRTKILKNLSLQTVNLERDLVLFKDCCNSGGWGVSLGLSSCDEDSKKLAQLRNEGKCVQIGTYCAEKEPILKTCIRKKTVFCCFGSKFAKLLQEQGKRQLGQNFGSPEQPNCRGFTAEELSRIDFSKLDLTEISRDVMEKFKPVDTKKHFAKGDEQQKIRETMNNLPMMEKMQNAGSREGAYLNENMKHLTGSARIK